MRKTKEFIKKGAHDEKDYFGDGGYLFCDDDGRKCAKGSIGVCK